MTDRRGAQRARAWSPGVLVQFLTIVLMVAVFGTLAVHHAADESVPVQTASAASSVESARFYGTAVSPDPVAAVSLQAGDAGWAGVLVTGCAALGLICVLGLALFRRPVSAHRLDVPGAVVRTVWTSVHRWESAVALGARPSLESLSISRT